MQNYTFTFVVSSATSADELKKIDDLLTQNGGQISKKDDWGKKMLSYPIKNQVDGKYFDFQLSLAPTSIQSLRTKLHLNENILRFLLIRQK